MDDTLAAILSESRDGQGSLIALLQRVQDALGHVPEEAVHALSERLGVPASEVFGVVTFYAQFRLAPRGRTVIKVCRGTACHVRRGVAVRKAFERLLGIADGGTTPDGAYSLETVACIGACALAPAVVVNDEVRGQVTVQQVEEMLAAWTGDDQAGDGHEGDGGDGGDAPTA